MVVGVSKNEPSGDWVPSDCTLPTLQQPLRRAEFDELFSTVQGVDRVDPTRLVLTISAVSGRADAVRELTRRESECCSFFTFTVVEGDPVREIAVPSTSFGVLDALTERARQISGLTR